MAGRGRTIAISIGGLGLADPSPGVRRSTALLLGELGAGARQAAPALRRALEDGDPEARRAASKSLERVQGRGR